MIMDNIKYKHHIVFDVLQEGSYFGSRSILDDLPIKIFIR